LDILGQQPLLNLYTQICLCYPIEDASLHSTILATLTAGLERLSAKFPWVAGEIVNKGQSETDTGVFKIQTLEKAPQLVVKDVRNDPTIPTMEEMRLANFPIRMLDEEIFASRRTIPKSDESRTCPVFGLQATFINGGLVLTFVGQHQAMDMTGQSQIMHLLSKACHNEEFSTEELQSGNLERQNLISLLDDSYVPGPEMEHQIQKPSRATGDDVDGQVSPSPTPKCSWADYTFDATSLAAIKALASKSISPPAHYVSTDDALSAFIWQSVSRARLARLEGDPQSKFARAIDARRYVGVSKTYTGLLQNMSYHMCAIRQLVEEPLGMIASQLRLAVDPGTSDVGFRTRALATLMSRTPDKREFSFVTDVDVSVGLMLSSWSKENCYGLDFNLGLGKPDAVRRPRFVPVEGLAYLLPRRPNGDITIAICLRDEDMERLRTDSQFSKYASYDG
jgi:hypothetical protein